jgi:hypothetical protein
VAKVGDEVRVGERIEIGEGGSAVLAYRVGAKVDLGEHSTLNISAAGGSARGGQHSSSKLEKGKLVAEVEKQSEGQPFVVETPHAKITVVGTRFEVTAAEASTRLDVSEGVVRLKSLIDHKVFDLPRRHYAVTAMGKKTKVGVTGKTERFVARTRERAPRIPLPRDLERAYVIGSTESTLWVSSDHGSTVYALDLSNGKTLRKIDIARIAGSRVGRLAWDGSHFWAAAEGWDGTLKRIDPESKRVVKALTVKGIKTTGLPNAPFTILSFGDNRVWVSFIGGRTIYGVNAEDGSVRRRIKTYEITQKIAFWQGTLLVGWKNAAEFSPVTGQHMARIRLPDSGLAGLTARPEGGLWTVSRNDHEACLLELEEAGNASR